MRTLAECRALIHRHIQGLRKTGRRGEIVGVDFVVCEDGKTIMTYVDLNDENDAVAFWFDLPPGEVFNHDRYCRDFFRPMAVQL
jgi:hypothetical protein